MLLVIIRVQQLFSFDIPFSIAPRILVRNGNYEADTGASLQYDLDCGSVELDRKMVRVVLVGRDQAPKDGYRELRVCVLPD